MRPQTAIFLLFFLSSCSSWSGQPITSKAIVVKGQQLDSIRLLFKHSAMQCNLSIRTLKTANTAYYDSVSLIDTNNNVLQIVLTDQNKTFTTEIAVSNSLGNYTYANKLGDSVLCEQTPNIWFTAWFNEPFYKNEIAGDLNKSHRYELHLRAIEKSSGKIVANEILYTTDCCIDRLSMKYNPYTQSLIYAFNDFGGRDFKVIYGQISIQNNKLNFQKPYHLTFEDESEKRQPTFVDNGRSIFLYHTTGDSWELLSGHLGKQQIGIFQVDSQNNLANHRTVRDTAEIDEKILFVGDTIFYRLRNSNEYDKMTIKKIAWKDLKEN